MFVDASRSVELKREATALSALKPFYIAFIATVLLLPASGVESAFAQQAHRPNEFELILTYYKQSGIPLPWSDLAQHFDDYRRARNEFDRQQLLSQLRPVIEKELDAVGTKEPLLFPTSIVIGEYDFQRGVFPLSVTPLMYSEFYTNVPGPPIAILFLNADKFATWALPREEGSKLLSTLHGSRSIAADIVYRPVRAREGFINRNTYRIIDVEILRMNLSTSDRTVPIGVLVP